MTEKKTAEVSAADQAKAAKVAEQLAAKQAREAKALEAKTAREAKATAKAAEKAAKAANKQPGVGDVAKQLIRDGKTNEEVLAAVKEQFPAAATSMASINWYRNNLRTNGTDEDQKNVKTARELKSAGQPPKPTKEEKAAVKAAEKATKDAEKAAKKAAADQVKAEAKAAKAVPAAAAPDAGSVKTGKGKNKPAPATEGAGHLA